MKKTIKKVQNTTAVKVIQKSAMDKVKGGGILPVGQTITNVN